MTTQSPYPIKDSHQTINRFGLIDGTRPRVSAGTELCSFEYITTNCNCDASASVCNLIIMAARLPAIYIPDLQAINYQSVTLFSNVIGNLFQYVE